jgi:hypothetical protein
MGTSMSLAAAGNKLGQVGKLIDGSAKREGLAEIGKEGKEAMTKAIVSDLGADQMMRNKKVRVTAGYDFVGSDAVAFEPRGGKVVWRWLVDGVAPHMISAHGGGQSRRRSRQTRTKSNQEAFNRARGGITGALFWSGAKHPVRFARHPGMKEKGTWDDAVRRVVTITPGKVYDRSIAKALGSVF